MSDDVIDKSVNSPKSTIKKAVKKDIFTSSDKTKVEKEEQIKINLPNENVKKQKTTSLEFDKDMTLEEKVDFLLELWVRDEL